nr:MAG TPA: hypothetical protein [Caudoviricetes sp.]
MFMIISYTVAAVLIVINANKPHPRSAKREC